MKEKDAIKKAMDILVNFKGVPEEIGEDEVYALHWTIPDEDGMVGARRTSILLFKTLKNVAEYLIHEAGLNDPAELMDSFQDENEEDIDVWDIIVLDVIKEESKDPVELMQKRLDSVCPINVDGEIASTGFWQNYGELRKSIGGAPMVVNYAAYKLARYIEKQNLPAYKKEHDAGVKWLWDFVKYYEDNWEVE